MTELSVIERGELVAHEGIIERGLSAWVDVSQALLSIRDARLYRETHKTFEDYCQKRWGFTDRRARQLIDAGQIGTTVPVENEAQARELAPLKDDEQEIVEAWREAKDAAAAEGKQLSAKVVRNAVQRRVERIKRENEAEQRRDSPVEPVTETDDVRIHHADFRSVFEGEDLADGIVVTDPPYPREFLPEWEAMAEATANAGCKAIVAMCGQSILVEAIAALQGGGWTYRWCGAYLTVGPATRVWGANVGTSWKPILVFDRGEERDFLTTDLFRSTGDDKQHHYWGQNENGIAALVEAFTKPGDLVVDPFLGGGTTAVVCKALGRRFLGCDLDGAAVEASRERLAA